MQHSPAVRKDAADDDRLTAEQKTSQNGAADQGGHGGQSAASPARETPDYGLHILPQHAALLKASAIPPEVARARGYVSVDTKKRLENLGFERYQRSVPGLLIPARRADGSVWGYQYRPDEPRTTKAGTVIKYETPKGQRNGIDIPPGARDAADDPSVLLLVTEGARKADAAVSAGIACVSLNGVDGWRGTNGKGGKLAVADWNDIALNGRRIVLAFDSDVRVKPGVRAALGRLAGYLPTRDATVEYLHLHDEGDSKTGLDDYLAAHGAGGLWELIRPEPPELLAVQAELSDAEPSMNGSRGDTNISGTPPQKAAPDAPAMTISQVETTYAKWLHDGDRVTTRVVHAVYVANMILPGDPVWMFLVGGSGSGKTERLMPLDVMPGVWTSSKLSGEAALLSATPRKDSAADAHGGLLRQVGAKGIIIVKDFTSTLEMDRTARGEVLAALREVYDGRWDRGVGAEGGRTLTWTGKCGFLAGCTTAIDRAHGVMNDMGPRSLFVRLPAASLDKIAGSALDHMGREDAMRKALGNATAGLLTHLTGQPHAIDQDARAGLIGLASMVSQARSPVHRDYKGEIELVGDSEAPTRIVKQLGQLWRACGVLGLDQAGSWEVVRRCALDSIPKLRGTVIRYLDDHGTADTTAVGRGVVHPSRTVRRALEDLEAHHVVNRISAGPGHADRWELSGQARAWLTAGDTLPETSEPPGKCDMCGDTLHPKLAAAGYTTHPTCDPGEVLPLPEVSEVSDSQVREGNESDSALEPLSEVSETSDEDEPLARFHLRQDGDEDVPRSMLTGQPLTPRPPNPIVVAEFEAAAAAAEAGEEAGQ